MVLGFKPRVIGMFCKHSAVYIVFHFLLVPLNSVVFSALTRIRWGWGDGAGVKSMYCFLQRTHM